MNLRTTPFVEHHRAAGAKLVPFAGFLMPLQYEGILAEHAAVRKAAGLFDVSHMGEFLVAGEGAAEFVDRLVTNDVAGAEPGQAVYTPMCLPDGGIVDDLLVYRYPDRLMLVVNAANIQGDWEHVAAQAPAGVTLDNRSGEIGQLALQGPNAVRILEALVPPAVLELPYYRFAEITLFEVTTTVSRTGYTGEDGFELYFPAEYADRFWQRLMRAGAEHGLKPCGLGARDLLRLEMGYCLYGNDIDRTTHPLEAGLGWTVKLDKPDFVGKPALLQAKAQGMPRKLVGFEVEGPRLARPGMEVRASGEVVGKVTSGSFSPSVEKGIGMAYVATAHGKNGSELAIQANNTQLSARVAPRPFYGGAYHSRKRDPKPSEAKS